VIVDIDGHWVHIGQYTYCHHKGHSIKILIMIADIVEFIIMSAIMYFDTRNRKEKNRYDSNTNMSANSTNLNTYAFEIVNKSTSYGIDQKFNNKLETLRVWWWLSFVALLSTIILETLNLVFSMATFPFSIAIVDTIVACIVWFKMKDIYD